MSLREVMVEGTLKPDGSLELDESPNLPPGRVEVMLGPEASPVPEEDTRAFLERLARERQSCGTTGRTREQIDAEITALRDELEERLDKIEQIRGRGVE